MEKIYYLSNIDNQVHNINDVKHLRVPDMDMAEILASDGEVIDTVGLHHFDAIISFIHPEIIVKYWADIVKDK